MIFSLSVMYNCIYILPFLGLEDTSFANFSSASHVFYDLRILLIEIVHPQRALSILCGYSPVKLCILEILHLQSPKIHYRRYSHKNCIPNACPATFYSLIHLACDNVQNKKIDIRNSSEYGTSVGDT